MAGKTTTWYVVLAPATLLYIAIALYVAWDIQPISRLFHLSANHTGSRLLDLCFAMLPLVGLLAWYLIWLDRKRKLSRIEFISEFEGGELVQATSNRNLVYNVQARTIDGSIDKMQVVWTPDGRCRNGRVYDSVDESSIRKFNATRFLNG